MNHLMAFTALLLLAACEPHPNTKAAAVWTQHYPQQPLEAHAAGSDCAVLLIEAETRLDDGLVESIHYGISPYDAYEDGAQQFAIDQKFRAVVYRDAAGTLWTYGAIAREEARSLSPCD